MKAIIVLSLLVLIGLILLMYKREKNIQKMLFSLALLGGIIGLAIVGNVMRSIMPLFIAHIVALLFAYGGLFYYVIRERTQWILWILPLLTVTLYVVLAWVGNKHIIWFA